MQPLSEIHTRVMGQNYVTCDESEGLRERPGRVEEIAEELLNGTARCRSDCITYLRTWRATRKTICFAGSAFCTSCTTFGFNSTTTNICKETAGSTQVWQQQESVKHMQRNARHMLWL